MVTDILWIPKQKKVSFKGIVHPKIAILCFSPFGRKVKNIFFNWNHGPLVPSQWLLSLCESKKHIKQHKINICASWWYFEVWWSETIGVYKKLNIIYNIITYNP